MSRPLRRGVLRARGQRRAGRIAGAMPHVRVAGVAQQQQPSSERSMMVVCAGCYVMLCMLCYVTNQGECAAWPANLVNPARGSLQKASQTSRYSHR